jgi:FkbM family methyltransferase
MSDSLLRRFHRLAVGKLWAVRALWRIFRHLRNWREVWEAYRSARTLPPLSFRRGFVLHHGRADNPMLLLHSVFAAAEYEALTPGDSPVLIDIGANIGAVTLDKACRYPAIRVDAYEPNPATFATLQRNVQESGLASRVRLFQEAVTGRNGTVLMWTGESSVMASTNGGPAIGGASMSVPTISLDHAIGRTGADHVIVKIDAEGAEVEMLESASEATLAAIDRIALEYHDGIVADARARCLAVLRRAGFTCQCMPFNASQGILVASHGRPVRARIPARWVRGDRPITHVYGRASRTSGAVR